MYRRHRVFPYLICITILICGSNALAGQGFSGTFTTNVGGVSWTLTLVQDSQNLVTGTLVSSSGTQFQIEGESEVDAVYGVCVSSEGGMAFEGTFEGDVLYFLVMELDDNNMPDYNNTEEFAFARQTGRSATTPTPPSLPSAESDPPQLSGKTPPAPLAGAGSRFEKASWGLSFTVPSGWNTVEEGGELYIRSAAGEGLIYVTFNKQLTPQEAHQSYTQGIHEEGLSLTPSGQARDFTVGRYNAVDGDLQGIAADGGQLRARAVAVFSPHGGGAVVVGLERASQFDTMKSLVEQLIGSMSFSEPQGPSVADILVGKYWFYSGHSTYTGGSYSREQNLSLCQDGTFQRGGETHSVGGSESGGGDGGGGHWVGSSHGNDGRWTAVGDERSGTITLIYNNGEQIVLEYTVSDNPKDMSGYGPAVYFGDDLYQRTGGGSCR